MEKFNVIKVASLLIVAIVVFPLVILNLNFHLSPFQWQAVQNSFYIVIGIATACFLLAETTGNCSQVDKIWSVTPVIYTWYFAFENHFEARTTLMAVCVTIWGIRLTYNFSRRGAYRLRFWEGEEDYRWEVLRQNPVFKNSKIAWTAFNLFFISFYQNTLIWLITLPTVMAMSAETRPVDWVDIFLATLFIGLVIFETIADQQQWNYQNEKYRKLNAGEPLEGIYAKGFVSTGLWKYMRHPNYFAEQTIWVTFYFFSVAATGAWLNPSGIGAVLLLLLFQGSANFSEGISANKYIAYKEYQNKTGKFLPKLF